MLKRMHTGLLQMSLLSMPLVLQMYLQPTSKPGTITIQRLDSTTIGKTEERKKVQRFNISWPTEELG